VLLYGKNAKITGQKVLNRRQVPWRVSANKGYKKLLRAVNMNPHSMPSLPGVRAQINFKKLSVSFLLVRNRGFDGKYTSTASPGGYPNIAICISR
jgi:hypothetical protein